MVLWKFDLPSDLKLPKIIGFMEQKLYVFVHNETSVYIYELNLFLPQSWRLRWKFEFAEISYFICTVAPHQSCIFALFTGCYKNSPQQYSFDILRLDLNKDMYTRYTSAQNMSVFELARLYDIHFETDTLCTGEQDLFVYDRGLVTGAIPYTRFVLNHENHIFTGISEPVLADERDVLPAVYNALLNADQKRFVKLTNDNKLRLYRHDLEKWVEYVQSETDNDLNLQKLHISHTGIGVTYNENLQRTRFSVVSSPIKLLGGESALLTYKLAGRVIFFRMIFNDNTLSFQLKKVAKIDHSVNQGYMFCDLRRLIIVSHPSYVVFLQPLTLRELAFKQAQCVLKNATDDTNIRQFCGIKHSRPLF